MVFNYLKPAMIEFKTRITFSNLGNVIFGLLQVFIYQSEMPYHLNIIVMSNFSLSVVSNSVSSCDSQVFNTSQQIGVRYHIPDGNNWLLFLRIWKALKFDNSNLYQRILPPHRTTISSFDSCREMVKERCIRTIIPI